MNNKKQTIFLLSFILVSLLFNSRLLKSQDLARYTPKWFEDGFVNGGATHEPWFYQIRRNNESFNIEQKQAFDYALSEDYIRSLSEAGVTIYHIFCYKGFGLKEEKSSMDRAAEAASIAHKYGMKVDTYVNWNTLGYETFLNEVPEARGAEPWYQIDINGKPILLQYGYQQSFRYRPCFNNDNYMNYFKEKILRYVVEKVNTDFIHFDNFDFNNPRDADHNPATIRAFRDYVMGKYTLTERKERFGFSDITKILPPIWNESNPANAITFINDPVLQEWTDFRCWTMNTRLAECARFVRELKKDVVIECNPHGLIGTNRQWDAGIDHSSLMQFTNCIWTEDENNPKWENGIAIGKFRHYKLGRTLNNFILTYNSTPQDWAENLALNRTVGWIGVNKLPQGTEKMFLDFWKRNKDLYINTKGAEKVAILRSYPSMAYNRENTHIAVNMAEQVLQQRQIPFDIIFDEQINILDQYSVLILANQESLSDVVLDKILNFVRNGGGLVLTDNTALYDKWRRKREKRGLDQIFTQSGISMSRINESSITAKFGKGEVVYIPQLIIPSSSDSHRIWKIPVNADELEAAIHYVSKSLPLVVESPEWIGVSHDSQPTRDIIHLFNYRHDYQAVGITLRYEGDVRTVWAVSPQREERIKLDFEKQNGLTIISLPILDVYEVLVVEK